MENETPTLTVLAAGMGSRYGGLKQIDPIGPHGEIIIDYSVYDAYLAGFRKVIFIIKKENQELFEERIGRHARKYMEVDYAFQELSDIPAGCTVPAGRVKPWGTGHAVLALRDKVHEPFAVLNSDDFYGRETYQRLFDFLKTAQDGAQYQYCMVGFALKNTLTANGAVSRGVCAVENGKLLSVTERTKIERDADGIFCLEEGEKLRIPEDATASLNVWGFAPSIFGELESGLTRFFETAHPDPLKSEFYLPQAVDDLIRAKKASVSVLETGEHWYGVTYREDKETVAAALAKMHADGRYPKLK